jgi:hypothetical protein
MKLGTETAAVFALIDEGTVAGYIAIAEQRFTSPPTSPQESLYISFPALAIDKRYASEGRQNMSSNRNVLYLVRKALSVAKARRQDRMLKYKQSSPYAGLLCIPHHNQELREALLSLGFEPLEGDAFYWRRDFPR